MKGVEPVGAKLAIHGDDLRCRWLVVIGPDRRSWRYDCCTCLSAGCGVAGTAGSHAQSKNREILVRRPRGRRATSPGAKCVPTVAQSGKAGSTSPVESVGKPGISCLVGVLGEQMRSARAGRSLNCNSAPNTHAQQSTVWWSNRAANGQRSIAAAIQSLTAVK